MAEIAGAVPPPPPSLLRHSLKPFCSFPSLPALLLSALLLLAFRSLIYYAAFRVVSLAESEFELQLQNLPSNSGDLPPPPPRPVERLFPSSLEPEPFFPARHKSSPPSSSNSSFYYSTSASKSVRIKIPASHTTTFFFFFFSSPPEDQSQHSIEQSNKEAFLIMGVIVLIAFAYVLVIFVFVFVCSSVSGVVFYSVVSTAYFRRPLVPLQLFLSGSSIGMDRLTPLMLFNWMIKDNVLQCLMTLFILYMEDEVDLLKLVFNAKLIMPFSPVSLASPLSYSAGLSRFFIAWTLIDSLVSVVFTIPPLVKLMESKDKRKDKCEFKEGIFLLSLMPTQALFVKWCEAVLCGSFARSLMVKIGGRYFGGFVCAIVEVYFMVVWLNFYINVRCKEAELVGKRFQLRELEDSLDDVKLKS